MLTIIKLLGFSCYRRGQKLPKFRRKPTGHFAIGSMSCIGWFCYIVPSPPEQYFSQSQKWSLVLEALSIVMMWWQTSNRRLDLVNSQVESWRFSDDRTGKTEPGGVVWIGGETPADSRILERVLGSGISIVLATGSWCHCRSGMDIGTEAKLSGNHLFGIEVIGGKSKPAWLWESYKTPWLPKLCVRSFLLSICCGIWGMLPPCEFDCGIQTDTSLFYFDCRP